MGIIAEISTEHVRALLKARRVSLRKLADQVGIPVSTLSDAMRSRHGLSIDQLYLTARYFEVSLDALCDQSFDAEQPKRPRASPAAYARLDAHGKQMVDMVLQMELERCDHSGK